MCAGCGSNSWRTVEAHIKACAKSRSTMASRKADPGEPLWWGSDNQLKGLTRDPETAATFKLPTWTNPPNDANQEDRDHLINKTLSERQEQLKALNQSKTSRGMVNLPTTWQGHIASARSPLRRKTASGQMCQYHPIGLEATADPQPANSSPITRRRVLHFEGMTIKVTADPNAATAIETTSGLPIDPEGDQEADTNPDIEEVTPSSEGTQGVLLTCVLLEGIAQAEGPDHDPDPDLGPGPGLTEEGQGLIPAIINQGQSLGPDQGPREDVVAIPEAMMVPDLQTTSAQDRTPSPHKANIELNRLSWEFLVVHIHSSLKLKYRQLSLAFSLF